MFKWLVRSHYNKTISLIIGILALLTMDFLPSFFFAHFIQILKFFAHGLFLYQVTKLTYSLSSIIDYLYYPIKELLVNNLSTSNWGKWGLDRWTRGRSNGEAFSQRAHYSEDGHCGPIEQLAIGPMDRRHKSELCHWPAEWTWL